MPEVTNFIVEAPAGQHSPPLVSEQAAHDWAASNRRGQSYTVRVKVDGQDIAKQEFKPRPE